MNINYKKGLHIGADGCRGGWIAAVLDYGELRIERYQLIGELVASYPVFDSFLIDMVIGLRDNSKQLRPDDLARKELGSRSSTVFPVPSRAAVYAEGIQEQKKANLLTLGKSLTMQTINIIPKIRELDEFLAENPKYQDKIRESHPELDFARLKGSVLQSRKKDPEGAAERIAVLNQYLPGTAIPDPGIASKELRCKPDDILDAVCLSVTAALLSLGLCETIPENPEQDRNGLLMMLTVPARNLGEMLY